MLIKTPSQYWVKCALIGLLLLQSGCDTLATPILKLDLPNQWRNAIANKPVTESADNRPQKLWWLSLNDSILNETVALALHHNLSLDKLMNA